MAYYLVEEQALSSIANAIREKTNNEEELSFPDGFVQSIGDIETSNQIELIPLTISANDTYTAPEGKAYTLVHVDVPNDDTDLKRLIERTTQTITLPKDLTVVGRYVFDHCEDLVLDALPDGIVTIQDHAFYNCTSLALTQLPDGITSIEKYAFGYCENLALETLPIRLETIDTDAFSNCKKIALTAFPNSLVNIGGNAFRDCSNLAITSLPSNLETIGQRAFQNCPNITISKIPSSIKTIGDYAFYGCDGLTSITFEKKPTSIGGNVFTLCSNLENIYVPWAAGQVLRAPWGASHSIIHYESVWNIQYDLDGGILEEQNPTYYTPADLPITLNNPTKEGYIFTGWTETSSPEPRINVTIPEGESGEKFYTATWMPI